MMVTVFVQRTKKEDWEPRSRFVEWLKDIKLLGSVYVARFIVWRALRRERKELSRWKR
jgi:hypothetical protein